MGHFSGCKINGAPSGINDLPPNTYQTSTVWIDDTEVIELSGRNFGKEDQTGCSSMTSVIIDLMEDLRPLGPKPEHPPFPPQQNPSLKVNFSPEEIVVDGWMNDKGADYGVQP